MEQVLHLFINNECGHNCPLCCNRLYKIDEIPVVTVELLKSVETVCLTGGDPIKIQYDILANFILKLRKQYENVKNLYVYTSGGREFAARLICLHNHMAIKSYRISQVNGINIAPKDFYDWMGFVEALEKVPQYFSEDLSNRLYVFKEQRPVFEALNIKLPKSIHVIDRQWTKSFNTPKNEHFARLPILF